MNKVVCDLRSGFLCERGIVVSMQDSSIFWALQWRQRQTLSSIFSSVSHWSLQTLQTVHS